jgi:hypothetical protein
MGKLRGMKGDDGFGRKPNRARGFYRAAMSKKAIGGGETEV